MRKRSIFSRRIKCFHCGGGMKIKSERGKKRYICTNYDNFGKCQRIIISEERILKALSRRFRRELVEDEIKEVVFEVIVKSDTLFEIILMEGNPISYHERGIVF